MPNPVVHFEMIGNDQSLLEGFYRDVFDWKITPHD
jgi:predicted enzyme related to lactoylglutathione lyase